MSTKDYLPTSDGGALVERFPCESCSASVTKFRGVLWDDDDTPHLCSPTVTVTCARKRYTLTFSKLPGQSFGPYEFAEAISQLYVCALLSRPDARNLVMDAATSAKRTATAPMGE
jgi:hypothetical protein